MNEDINFEGKILKKRWEIIQKIGKGSYGYVFICFDKIDKNIVAVKIEENRQGEKLNKEAKIIKYLSQSKIQQLGIPKLHFVGIDDVLSQYIFMVIDMLGPSLEDLFQMCNKNFSLKTVLMIAEGCINIIEYIHQQDFIHRDIKPSNFLLGLGENTHIIYLVDFGLSQQYQDQKTKEHIAYQENQNLAGTARYMSLNSHFGIQQSRRDDLESLAYMLIYLLKGHLPWQGMKFQTEDENYKSIGNQKLTSINEQICEDLPLEFLLFLKYAKTLQFKQKPDYQYIKNLFRKKMKEMNFDFDYRYDWTYFEKINKDVIESRNLPIIFEENDANEDNQQEEQFQVIQKRRQSIMTIQKPSIFRQNFVGDNKINIEKLKEIKKKDSQMNFQYQSSGTSNDSEFDQNVSLCSDQENIVIKQLFFILFVQNFIFRFISFFSSDNFLMFFFFFIFFLFIQHNHT